MDFFESNPKMINSNEKKNPAGQNLYLLPAT